MPKGVYVRTPKALVSLRRTIKKASFVLAKRGRTKEHGDRISKALKGKKHPETCTCCFCVGNPGKHPENCQCPFHRDKSGKNHPGWLGGISFTRYPQEFNHQLRERILRRDGYRCRGLNCELTQMEHLIIYGRDIEIHHINYVKKNCKETNLITLCKQCNLRANFNRSTWKKYYQGLVNA